MRCPHCGLINPSTAQRCDCGYDFDKKALTDKGIPPVEAEATSMADRRWLWAARCSALICTIAFGVGFVAEAAALSDGPASGVALTLIREFGRQGSLSVALLYLLFRRGKNSLAFGLGLGAATAFIALLAFASMKLHLDPVSHLMFILAMFGGIGLPLIGEYSPQVATLGALLLWSFIVCSAMLALSSVVAFQKMAHQAKGRGKLRLAFGAGICCVPVVWLISLLLFISFFGGFGM
jgi:hypothetical protein